MVFISVAPKQKTIYSYRMIMCFSGKIPGIAIILLCLCVISQGVFSQEAVPETTLEEAPETSPEAVPEVTHSIPDSLRRPERGEAPRYPEDLVIGVMGQGESSDGAYLFARNLLSALTESRRNAAVITGSGSYVSESIFEEIRSIRPRNYRLGGGKREVDGCVSFLVRFIGNEESISGELFIRQRGGESEDDGRWFLDDLILEDKRNNSDIRDSYRFEFTPYERFF